MARRRCDWLFLATASTTLALLLTVSIGAEFARLEIRRADDRAKAEEYRREARRLGDIVSHEFETVETLRRISERHRMSAHECGRNAERYPPGFARELWRERAENFQNEAARVTDEANDMERAAIHHQFDILVFRRAAMDAERRDLR
jgi:hypothetical protein